MNKLINFPENVVTEALPGMGAAYPDLLKMEPVRNDLPFKSGDEVLLFVNGLGGTPLIELRKGV